MNQSIQKLKKAVYEANMELYCSGLVLYTFGNVSGVDRKKNLMVIKPSGVSYESLKPVHMVCVDLTSGKTMNSALNPSTDAPTHLELYRAFHAAGGVVHTHSLYATSCAQARTPVRCMGTTHADYFFGDIPVTRPLTKKEIVKEYEKNTGLVIVERFAGLDPQQIQAVLVANHGPFVWGADASDAVHNAVVLEYLAKMEIETRLLNPRVSPPAPYLIHKHYYRKHGNTAYYGQRYKSH